MATTAGKTAKSLEEQTKAPGHRVVELLDGELVATPPPGSPLVLAASLLGVALAPLSTRKAGAVGGWWILDEPELRLGGDVLVPNLAGWRRERMPSFPAVPHFKQVPDWVCELISPVTARLDRIQKMRVYAREKVSHLWFVDPQAMTLEVYRLGRDHWMLVGTHGGSELVRAEPFDTLELDLGSLWLDGREIAELASEEPPAQD